MEFHQVQLVAGPDYPDPATPLVGEELTHTLRKAVYYRDMTAKRPVNIRIQMKTGSPYLETIETLRLCPSTGAFANPRF